MAIPKGWNLQSLSQDVELRSGQHLLADEWHHEPIGVPYLTGPADFPNGHIVITKYTEHPKVMCSAGDVLITVKGSGCGRLARVSSAACISRQLMAIRPCTWNSDFIFQVLTASSQLLADQASGLIPGLTREQLLNLQFPIPPLPEQKKIAAVLSSVDAAIEKTEAVIAQLQVVKKAMMEQLLTKGLPGRHTRFKQTDLGVIPEDWEAVQLPMVADYQNGKAFPSSEYQAKGVRLVRPGNMHISGWLSWDDKHTTYLPDSYWDALPSFRVYPGEILMNLTAQSLDDEFLGRVCVVPPGEACILNQRIARIIPTQCNPGYLFWALRGPHFRKHVDRIPQGSKVQHLYNRDLDESPLVLPTSTEQIEIAAILDSIQTRIVDEEAVLNPLRAVKSSLSSSLLSGELRVPTDSVPCPV